MKMTRRRLGVSSSTVDQSDLVPAEEFHKTCEA